MLSNSPCAACKFLRRKCTQECVFAPYFPPDQPAKFANVHRVYGASNVSKILNDLPATQREDAVNSLAYEADARLRDPVYGCVGLISILQRRLKQVQADLENAKRELANYTGPSALLPVFSQGFIQQSVLPYAMQPEQPETVLVTGARALREVQRHQHQQQMNNLTGEREQHEPRSAGELLGFGGGLGAVPARMTAVTAAAMSSCLSLGGSYDNGNGGAYQIQQQPHHLQQPHQLFLHQQQVQPQGAE